MAKQRINTKLMFGLDITDPQDAIHMGEGKRIRLEDTPLPDADGDNQVGHRAYNDERYALRGTDSGNVSRFLKGGSWVWTRTGLVFRTLLTEYLLPGMTTPIVVLPTDIDLAEFPELDNATNPQFARPQWDITGSVVPIFGTADADPVIPEVEDPETQIAGSPVLLAAGEVVPEVPVTVVYEEYEAGEFAVTSTGTGVLDPDSTESPDAGGGTKSIKFSAIVNNDAVILTADADFAVADFTLLSMRLKLIAQFYSGHDLRVLFQNNAGTSVSSIQILNIQKANLDYQQIGIAFDEFSFTASLARKIQISFRRSRGASVLAGFYLDNIFLQGGIIPPVIAGTIELTGHVAGSGETGEPINVTITEKAISEQTEQTDPLPSTAQAMFRLADGTLVKVAASLLIGAGVAGEKGWSPVFGLVTDGDRRVLQLVDWIGGEGTKPATGQYIGPTGLVATAAEGVDLRGSSGLDGDNGTEIELQVSGTMLQWRYVGAGSWTDLFDLSTLSGEGLTIPEIVTGLEALTGEDKLSASALKDLPTVEQVQEEFTWTTGAQEFTLTDTPVGLILVFVGTTHLRESQYTLVGTLLTITPTLPNPSLVVVFYNKTTLIGGYPEVNLSTQDFFEDASIIYKRGGNVPQSIVGGVELTFRRNTAYGTVAAPVSGAITMDLTDANIGAEAILIYDDTAFSPPSGCVIKPNSEAFDNTKVNVIIFRYLADDLIMYDINPFTV